jgi:hypothetical protein
MRSSRFQLCPQGADSPRAGGGQSATCEFVVVFFVFVFFSV